MGKIHLRSAWTLRMYRPRGPYGPLLRVRHKSPGIAANNMRVKFISPVDSYVTALLCVCFPRGSPEEEEVRRGESRETAFAWKYAGWLSTLENLNAIDYTPRGKQYCPTVAFDLPRAAVTTDILTDRRLRDRFFRRRIEWATTIFAYVIIHRHFLLRMLLPLGSQITFTLFFRTCQMKLYNVYICVS